ncbi:DNA/RNA non-specific endonuclease [Blastococcus montanus]|uniref:DNA/RNA non-specific endonuclease n=1 Tax=Blastococcus montanus TaxID=3144973 RepID=UPI00320A88D3
MPEATGSTVFREGDDDRLYRRLRALTAEDLSSDLVRRVAAGDLELVESLPFAARAGVAALVRTEALAGGALERMVGPALDFVPVAYLDRARLAANAVARVVTAQRQAVGTGTLVSTRLLLTNHHVTPNAAAAAQQVVQFDYELGMDGVPVTPSEFHLDPTTFFWTSHEDELDATVVAVGPQLSGGRPLAAFGRSSLTAAQDKHAEGDFVTIVQHPDGDFKQVALRENRVVGRGKGGVTLHYQGDTLRGSSGSPVFNDQFDLVALHHAGGPRNETSLDNGQPVPDESNEGIRVSSLAMALREVLDRLPPEQRAVLAEALDPPRAGPDRESAPATAPIGRSLTIGSAETELQIPVRITAGDAFAPPTAVSALTTPDRPSLVGPVPLGVMEKNRPPDDDYRSRRGYRPDFLGSAVPLPTLSAELVGQAAVPAEGRAPDDLALRYVHFSVIQNGERRMPFCTAVNIDGKRLRGINRRTGEVEAAEKWYLDPRISPDQQLSQKVFEAQRPRIFDRGHLVRRLDPAWGSAVSALRGASDTFHFTNCAPQVSAFNQRTALWAGIENYVLTNARAGRKRVSVFTGPVFRADDPHYRGVTVPRAFWKIVMRVEQSALRATAFLASQETFLPDALEDFDDVGRVAIFQTRITDVTAHTGLDFGALADADSHGGLESAAPSEITAFDQVEW